MQKTRRDETWSDMVDNMGIGRTDLDEHAKEKLFLNHFLGLLDCSNVAFAVHQKKPKCLDDAIAATLEIEC